MTSRIRIVCSLCINGLYRQTPSSNSSSKPGSAGVIVASLVSSRVVLWLMMLQRLHVGASLATAVQLLFQGAADPLLNGGRQVLGRRISPNAGGFSQARQQLPALLCRQVNQQIVEQLRRELAEPEGAGGRKLSEIGRSWLQRLSADLRPHHGTVRLL
jgi:hypothetical protein